MAKLVRPRGFGPSADIRKVTPQTALRALYLQYSIAVTALDRAVTDHLVSRNCANAHLLALKKAIYMFDAAIDRASLNCSSTSQAVRPGGVEGPQQSTAEHSNRSR